MGATPSASPCNKPAPNIPNQEFRAIIPANEQRAIAVTHGQLVAVGTYTSRHPFGGPFGRAIRNLLAAGRPRAEGIYLASVDPAGQLGTPRLAAVMKNPSWIARHPTQPVIYAVSEIGRGAVHAFRIQGDQLELIEATRSGGAAPCYATIDAAGSFLCVANYASGSLSVIALRSDGGFGDRVDVRRHHGSGPDPQRQASAHPHCIAISPDRRWALVPDLGADRVFVYPVVPEIGLVAADPASVAVAPGAGPRHLAFHPSGRFVVLVNELESTLVSYAFDSESGRLAPVAGVSTLPLSCSQSSTAADVRIHGGGRFAFVSNRGYDSIASVAIDQRGHLEVIAIDPTGGRTPRGLALDPSGSVLLAAHQDSDEVISFAVDAASGRLNEVARVRVPTCACVAFL